ncbi:hypothetical protein HHO41_17815 [Bacillus sp. DNRA2]|uniref:DUF6154 family protein n=1 Tax=Bacillus sp. DNRA2 TaxID=2723053 RepID=UPI00145CC730|nr:DUF6154 family protein [Bacillus sp. DNRA2]NMD72135.1 hypothetical protein [Bacillus sp. DNRA2]
MKLVDELFELYRDKLTGDDEDIDMLAFAILEEMSREDLLHLIQELSTQELHTVIGVYLIESLREKFAQQEYGQHRPQTIVSSRNIH